ncbi:MAG: ATP-binding protein, partial [Verrucomicrobiota bacterium]
MKTRLLKVEIRYEHDVVLSRQRARQVSELLGFNVHDQVRIATAVSEIARNAFRYAKGGKIEFFVETDPQPILRMVITDQGSGIPNLPQVLEGKYISRTGMGLGITGAKKLMDRFEISSTTKGTTVTLERFIESRADQFSHSFIANITQALAKQNSQEPFAEVQQQNQELLAAFSELETRQNELARLNFALGEAQKKLNLQNEQLEIRVEERTSELKESLLQMERFCYSIAHDLKSPIRAISGLTLILKEDYASAFDAPGKDYTNRIIDATARMDALIADLLEYGKLTHIEVLLAPLQLNHEIGKTLAHLRAEISSTKGVVEVQKELPIVVANPVLLHQVLCNLIENALKFM